MDQRLERAPFGVLVTDPDGVVTASNEAARTLLDGAEGLAGTDVRSAFPYSVERTIARSFDGPGPSEERTFEEYYPELDRWLSVTVAPTDESATVYVRDVTDRKAAERTERHLRGELERLTIVDGLVSEILSELIDASTREEIAETICERLGRTEIYEFAWVGERELGGDGIVVRAAAGETGRTFERVRETLDGTRTGVEDDSATRDVNDSAAGVEDGPVAGPEVRAVETGELQLVEPLAEDRSVPKPIRQAAFADGLRSALAIPLTYGSSVHGVVGVYAAGEEAFSRRERASFETVGRIAGFAVDATRHRNLLRSDSVVEVTFGVGADGGPLAATAADLDATLTLDGTVPRDDGSVLGYVGVDGADPRAVVDSLEDRDAAGDARVITRGETAGVVEVALDSTTPVGVLSDHGATVRSAEFEGDEGRIVGEFSPERDVRRVADAVTGAFDGTVIAKRRREREVTTPAEFRDELRDRLTDRQETVLRTAFFADYFESPRNSTAEEVAEVLDITGPTLLYHLRAGQRKLLESFFDDTDDRRRSESAE